MFNFFTCSQVIFAKIIGTSAQYVGGYLSACGVVLKNYNGRIKLFYSLQRYFNDYAWSFGSRGRLQAINNAAARVYRLKPPKRKLEGVINSCRAFLPVLKLAKFKYEVLKILMALGCDNPKYLIAAESELENLREQLLNAQNELKAKILAAKIKPVQAETILLARYVDCELFSDIAEGYSYSLSHVRRLHRHGLQKFNSAI